MNLSRPRECGATYGSTSQEFARYKLNSVQVGCICRISPLYPRNHFPPQISDKKILNDLCACRCCKDVIKTGHANGTKQMWDHHSVCRKVKAEVPNQSKIMGFFGKRQLESQVTPEYRKKLKAGQLAFVAEGKQSLTSVESLGLVKLLRAAVDTAARYSLHRIPRRLQGNVD